MLRAVGMIEAGSRQRTVALALNTSQSVISRLWTRYRSTGTVAERHGGRYRCTTRRQDRYIQILTRRAPTITAMMLAVRLHHSSGNLISDQTVRNRLHEVNLHSRRPLRVPPIAMHNRRIRYQWALEHRNWAEEQWRFVCFSDESRFGMRPDTRRIRHWRTPGRQQRLKSCQEVHPYSGGTIMVWAGIWIGGRTELIWIRGNLNAQIYAETIVSDVIVPLQVQIGPLFQLMHDNARPHTARVVRQTLAAANINVLPWPAQSPDLNPIEHAWDMLQRRALPNMEGIQSQEDLFLLLQRTWAAIPQRDLDELILNKVVPRKEEEEPIEFVHIFKDKGILSSVIPEYLGEWAVEKIKCEGVTVLPKTQVYDAFESADGRVELTLSNGTSLVADYVFVALGAEPRTEMAQPSFLETDDINGGFLVNTELEARTHLYVAGDAASIYSQWKDARRRYEHFDMAEEQGYLAGANMTGYWLPSNMEQHYWLNLGDALQVQVVGEVGGCMPTVGLFKPCGNETASKPQPVGPSGDTPCYKKREEYQNRYKRGMLFYLRDETVVGMVFWNFPPIEDRKGVATEILRAKPSYKEINLLAELLGFPEMQCDYVPEEHLKEPPPCFRRRREF
ncbi:hypothetical protein evm_004157 [Chilo suppressalis]|nr:hypothetical protein evm_004157 [Chilo suppressalis]